MLEIIRYGMAHRRDDGAVVLCRPGKNGGLGTMVEVESDLADEYRLADGDVVEGAAEPLAVLSHVLQAGGGDEDDWQWDEPSAVRGERTSSRSAATVVPSERLVSITRINGLAAEEALDRPSPRRRNATERSTPDRWIPLATGPNDATGRMLDFAAPFALGVAGIIYGPHASGLTRTLRSVVAGVSANAPEVSIFLLLLRARGEELTDWRRRFPDAEVIVCPSPQDGASADLTLRYADLTLECARRQTELGRHALLAVDSLTGLWGAMLEAEEADAQAEADRSSSRQRVRDWLQKAGNFGGEGLLGNALGGSLTLVGTVWNQAIDEEAEEERDVHPHLRLLEIILHETAWRMPLSETLSRQRLYPAIHTPRAFSQYEERLLPEATYERLLAARRSLSGSDAVHRYGQLMDALDATSDLDSLLAALVV